jgi:hypothetical protein
VASDISLSGWKEGRVVIVLMSVLWSVEFRMEEQDTRGGGRLPPARVPFLLSANFYSTFRSGPRTFRRNFDDVMHKSSMLAIFKAASNAHTPYQSSLPSPFTCPFILIHIKMQHYRPPPPLSMPNVGRLAHRPRPVPSAPDARLVLPLASH